MKINCIIIEDEPLAQERIQGYVKKISWLQLLHTFNNAVDAIGFLKSNQVDLIFLDIHLGELSGIQMLESSSIQSAVIITTAYHEFALKGYELQVTDYLLKPFTFERFLSAVGKVAEQKKMQPEKEKKFIFIKTEYRLEKILIKDILYIEGMKDYRRIFTTDKNVMTLQTFMELEKEIPSHLICRVHKSYMVAIDKIDSIERERIKIKDKMIPISETYRKSFYDLIKK
ncbi:MAG: response regulator transcription factor [Fimbriimonadaceae bacterium]|nr:response regulator transcription factor [Chitinophagales bacterium]